VALASAVCGAIGGLGFAGAAFLKLLLVSLGNRNLGLPPETVEAWAHYQSTNWHSVLEQTYGFINGIGVAVALGLLAKRVGHVRGGDTQARWTTGFATAFVLLGVLFLNMRKNAADWVKLGALPENMTMPLLQPVQLPATLWWAIGFALFTLAGVVLIRRHLRAPLPIIPATPLGRAQLMFLVFLWAMVAMNFTSPCPTSAMAASSPRG